MVTIPIVEGNGGISTQKLYLWWRDYYTEAIVVCLVIERINTLKP